MRDMHFYIVVITIDPKKLHTITFIIAFIY